MQISLAFRSPDTKVAMLRIQNGVPLTTEYPSITEMREQMLAVIDSAKVREEHPEVATMSPEDRADFMVAAHLVELRRIATLIDQVIMRLEAGAH